MGHVAGFYGLEDFPIEQQGGAAAQLICVPGVCSVFGTTDVSDCGHELRIFTESQPGSPTELVALAGVGLAAGATKFLYHGSPDFQGDQFDLDIAQSATRAGTGLAGIYLTDDAERAITQYGRDGQLVRTAVPKDYADQIVQTDKDGNTEYFVDNQEGVDILNDGTDVIQTNPDAILSWANGEFPDQNIGGDDDGGEDGGGGGE